MSVSSGAGSPGATWIKGRYTGYFCTHTVTATANLQVDTHFQDNLHNPAPERLNLSGF